MSSTFTYNYPVPGGTQDNNSYTTKAVIAIRDCSLDGVLGDCPPAWNDTKCANDDNYCNPYLETDKFYLQFRYDSKRAKRYELYAVDCETAEQTLLTPGSGGEYLLQQGTDSGSNSYQNFIVRPDRIDYDCFVLQLKVYGCPSVGFGVECRDEELVSQWCSDQYCPVKCNEQTLLVEGFYPKKDCFGHYYGTFITGSASNSYKAQVRVRAELYGDAFSFTETYIGDTLSRKDMSQRFVFQTQKIPPYIANKIAECFGAQYTYIDGVKYKKAVTIEKNFEEGQSWIVKTNIFIDCENPFTCQ